MAIRSLNQLRTDQARLLDEYRASLPSADASVGLMPDGLSRSDAMVVTVGKVTQVVTVDATLGAHLVVQPQVFDGVPPVAEAASKPTVVAYPTPNRVVGGYVVGDFVELVPARGAMLAVGLA